MRKINFDNVSIFTDTMSNKKLVLREISDCSDGARKKVWVNCADEIYLYKEDKKHVTGESTYESVAEYLASKIARGLNIKNVDIVLGNHAVLSKKMWDVELKSFLDYSDELSHSFHLSNLTTYNVSTLLSDDNIYRDEIIQMLLFDALIGNSDRHPGNYLYADTLGFYPLFDNGSSLCAYVEEAKIKEFLIDGLRFNALCESKSKPVLRDGQKITHHKLVEILKQEFPIQFSAFRETLESYDCVKDIESLPITEQRKELLIKFLEHRRAWFYE